MSLEIHQRPGAATLAPFGTYRCEPALPKPAVHPLHSPAGVVLSGFEMSDHVWHRGLWFTIKFINGENFWEEGESTGIQQSQGEPTCELLGDDRSRLRHHLRWTSKSTGPVIDERRTIEFASRDDLYVIDWTSELTALADLKLDRTPYTTWGGYGGLAFRASRELHDTTFLLPNGEAVAALTGQPHDWTVMQSSVDGGSKRRVSIGFVDHPSNPRSPSPWYNKGAGGFTFANAAFLFHEPMDLAKGRTLAFRYRIFIRDGAFTVDEFAALAKSYRATEVK